MAKKRNLSDLIAEETKAAELSTSQSDASEVSKSATNEVSDSISDKVTELQTIKVPNSISDKVTELQTTSPTDFQATELPNRQTAEVSSQQTLKLSDSQNNEVSHSEANAVPKYLTLVRKESRLREDQQDSLTSLARSLNRQRQGSGERITENTLIRIAVDLLMNHKSELKGTTEQELSTSLGLE